MALDAVPLLLSVIVRVLAIYGKWFLSRPEVATPLNSWSRLTEGVYLYNKGIYIQVLIHSRNGVNSK